jgi:hypothetical protein
VPTHEPHSEPDPGPLVDEGPGVGDSPLRPEEHDTYRTDPTAADGAEDATTPATDSRGWIIIGIVLFMAFVVVLVWSLLTAVA